MFGVWGHPEAAKITYYGLHSLQHRGQDGTGMVVSDGERLVGMKGEGLVIETFTEENLSKLTGNIAIGDVLYSHAGNRGYENVQPLLFHSQTGSLALASSGSLVNASQLRSQLEAQGSIFQTKSDAEILAHLIRRGGRVPFVEQVQNALTMLKGAYAFVIMTEKYLIAAIDPMGMRPLSLGKIGDAYVVASETCAFDIIGAKFYRDVQPGELIVISEEGLQSMQIAKAPREAMCAMEYVYFSRPDSNLKGINVHTARKHLGRILAKEMPIEGDVVTGVPDSSISVAIGYAEETGIPYEMGLIKNKYIGRTFIQPTQALREQGVKMKLSPVRGVVEGKRVIMVDDSIVRGTTSKRIVSMLREAGATEVHVVISSPPIKYPCHYGVDTTTQKELMAANLTLEEMRELIGADSLYFLSLEGLVQGISSEESVEMSGDCLACFTGMYPTEIFPNQFEEE